MYKHAQTVFPDLTEETVRELPHFNTLQDAAEIDVIRLLTKWPQVVLQAAKVQEPHRILNYLHDLAGAFHSLWNLGKGNLQLRFVDPNNRDTTVSKLALLAGVVTILRDGLELVGVDPVEEMR